jgi:argininosuccinate lyase
LVLKMPNKMWGGAFSVPPSQLMKSINSSIFFDKNLYTQDIQGSIAHARMLASQSIITHEDFSKIQNGLMQILEEISSNSFNFSEDLEDIHMNVENRLIGLIGETGKKLHTARSRNDQVATDFKLFTVEKTKEVNILLNNVLNSLLKKAEVHVYDIMPAFTHLQIAQPVSIAHYILAYFEMFKRDLTLSQSFLSHFSSECPLGSGALAGTTYNINRNQTAQDLNFQSSTRNSLDAVSDRDFAMDFMYLASRIGIHISRFAEEMILFATTAFGFVKFSDAYSTGSSIMPQKKNPDAAELLRGKSGRLVGNLNSLFVTMKGLPLAYSKDMQEDKEPLFDSAETIIICLRVLDGIVNDITFNTKKMRQMAGEGYSNATDFADYLVQKLNIPFRDAHHITGRVVAVAIQKELKIEELSLVELQQIKPEIEQDIFDFIKIENVVARRNSFGGTGFEQVKKQIEFAKEYLKNL